MRTRVTDGEDVPLPFGEGRNQNRDAASGILMLSDRAGLMENR